MLNIEIAFVLNFLQNTLQPNLKKCLVILGYKQHLQPPNKDCQDVPSKYTLSSLYKLQHLILVFMRIRTL